MARSPWLASATRWPCSAVTSHVRLASHITLSIFSSPFFFFFLVSLTLGQGLALAQFAMLLSAM